MSSNKHSKYLKCGFVVAAFCSWIIGGRSILDGYTWLSALCSCDSEKIYRRVSTPYRRCYPILSHFQSKPWCGTNGAARKMRHEQAFCTSQTLFWMCLDEMHQPIFLNTDEWEMCPKLEILDYITSWLESLLFLSICLNMLVGYT